MEAQQVLEIGREAIFVLLKISFPILFVALIIGLSISLIQALTQIQEATLSFVPKIFAIFFSILLFMPYMGSVMSTFVDHLAELIISVG